MGVVAAWESGTSGDPGDDPPAAPAIALHAGWITPLASWYASAGRHGLPWRRTRDPWAVLVSEVMLQQTSVARVIPRWTAFVERWPSPAACAAAPLEDVLRAWQGLGYPRRARALWSAAGVLSRSGWPRDEAGLRALPGVGAYTARALLAFAFDIEAPPARDVNLGRVAARAALGLEPHQVVGAVLDRVLSESRPPGTSARHHAFALFDLGATVCLARRPRCGACPLRDRCASRDRLAVSPPTPPSRRQARFRGSMRELRGAVLRAALGPAPPADLAGLRDRVACVTGAASPGAVEAAVAGLVADGLLPELPWGLPEPGGGPAA